MKYLKKFEQYTKQLDLFPDIKSSNDEHNITKLFVQRFKAQKDLKKDTNQHHNFETFGDVIKYYNSENGINKICQELFSSDQLHQVIISETAYNYFEKCDNKKEIIIAYFMDSDDTGTEIDDLYKKLKKERKIKGSISNNYDTIMNNIEIPTYLYELTDENIITDTEQFEKFIVENYEVDFIADMEEYDDLLAVLENISSENKMDIYRALELTPHIDDFDNLVKDYEGVGIYWSYQKDAVDIYSSTNIPNSFDIVLCAIVDINDINWNNTFKKCMYALNHEREIEIYKKSIIELNSIKFEGHSDEIYKNKMKVVDILTDTYKLSNKNREIVSDFYKEDADEKSHLVFNTPIKIKA